MLDGAAESKLHFPVSFSMINGKNIFPKLSEQFIKFWWIRFSIKSNMLFDIYLKNESFENKISEKGLIQNIQIKLQVKFEQFFS